MKNTTIEKYCDMMTDYIGSDLKDPNRTFIFTPINSRDFDDMFTAVSREATARGNGQLTESTTVCHPSDAVSACSCIISYCLTVDNRPWKIEFCHYTADNSKAIRATLSNLD